MSGDGKLRRGDTDRHGHDRPARHVVLGILAFAVLVLAAIWATALALAQRERDAVYDAARAELTGAQATLAAHIGRTFESAIAIQSSVDHWLDEHSEAGPPLPDLSALDPYVRSLQRHYERPVLVRLVRGDGRMIYPRLPKGHVVDFADREHFQGIRGKPSGSIHIGAPVASRITGQDLIPIMMSAHPNGFDVDYILVGIPVAPIADTYRDLLITARGVYGVLRADGMVLLRAPDRESITGTRHPRLSFDTLFPAKGAAGAEGIVELADPPLDRPQLVAYRRLDPLPLATYAAFDLDEVAQKAREQTYLPLGVAALGTMVTAAIALWLAAMAARREAEARRLHDALANARLASRAKTDFLANMSHELRTPLNAILGMSEMIDGAHLGPLPAKYRDYAGDIGRSGRHLLNLIEQILGIAQLERGAMRPDPMFLSVAEVLGEIEPAFAPHLAEARMRYVLDLPAELPPLHVDARMLRQMLLCLLGNAARYAGDGATVRVSAAADAQGFRLTVADTGPGIPDQTLRHVFEPFGRNNSSVARREGGLGLGLPMTKSLIELHDGSIEIATAPDQGTAVTLRFPPAALPDAAELRQSA